MPTIFFIFFVYLQVTIFKTVAQHLNFKYEIREPKVCCSFGRIGDVPANYTGLMSEVQNNFSDVCWSQLHFSLSKLKNMDLTASYDNDPVCFVVGLHMLIHYIPSVQYDMLQHHHLPPLPSWTSFYIPFKPLVWLFCFLSIVLSVIFIMVYGAAYPKSEYLPKDSTFFLMGVILESSQPHLSNLKSNTIRLFFVLFGLSFAVITCGYKGALTSSLSVIHEPPPYSQLNNLNNQCILLLIIIP
jgi:hypothetical protein